MNSPSSDDYQFWLEQGKAMTHLNRYEEALACFEQTLILKPDHITAWIWKAGVLTHLDNYSEALTSLDRALEICPNHVEPSNPYDKQAIRLFRGLVLHELGRDREAYSNYNQALPISKQPKYRYSGSHTDEVQN